MKTTRYMVLEYEPNTKTDDDEGSVDWWFGGTPEEVADVGKESEARRIIGRRLADIPNRAYELLKIVYDEYGFETDESTVETFTPTN